MPSLPDIKKGPRTLGMTAGVIAETSAADSTALEGAPLHSTQSVDSEAAAEHDGAPGPDADGQTLAPGTH